MKLGEACFYTHHDIYMRWGYLGDVPGTSRACRRGFRGGGGQGCHVMAATPTRGPPANPMCGLSCFRFRDCQVCTLTAKRTPSHANTRPIHTFLVRAYRPYVRYTCMHIVGKREVGGKEIGGRVCHAVSEIATDDHAASPQSPPRPIPTTGYPAQYGCPIQEAGAHPAVEAVTRRCLRPQKMQRRKEDRAARNISAAGPAGAVSFVVTHILFHFFFFSSSLHVSVVSLVFPI